MLDLVVLADTANGGGASVPVLVAVVSALGGIAATIVTQLFIKSKTTAEADKTTKEGNSALMDSASNFVAQTGEFGTRLMERIGTLEGAIAERDARISRLETELQDLKVEIARHEAARTVVADLRTELAKARSRAEAAELDVAKLEAIIVAAQVPVKGDAASDAEILERHTRLKRVAREMRAEQINGRSESGDEDEVDDEGRGDDDEAV